MSPADQPESAVDRSADLRERICAAVHTAIAAVSEDLSDDIQLNTAISELMKLSNAINATELQGLRVAVA